MMVGNKFKQAEDIGRDKTVKLLPNYQLIESTNPYEVWDFSGYTDSVHYKGNYFIEVKNRTNPSTGYTSAFLEYDKFKRLIEVADNNGKASVFYIMHFSDSITHIYNLRKLNLSDVNIRELSLPQTSMGTKTKVNKLMVELPYKLADVRKLE